MSTPFNRREILEREAARACDRIVNGRAIVREEQQLGRPLGNIAVLYTGRIREQQERWARAAACIARLEMTLAERRLV